MHPETSEEEVRSLFAQYGTIESVKACIYLFLVYNNSQLLPAKNCAFIKYDELSDSMRAYQMLYNGVPCHGNTLKIGWGKVQFK